LFITKPKGAGKRAKYEKKNPEKGEEKAINDA
jgi:hypothetical protein